MMSDEEKRAMGEALLAQLGRPVDPDDERAVDETSTARTGSPAGGPMASLGYFEKKKTGGGAADALYRLIGKERAS
jgi:hypothetical protein